MSEVIRGGAQAQTEATRQPDIFEALAKFVCFFGMVAAQEELARDERVPDGHVLASFMGSGASDQITMKDLRDASTALREDHLRNAASDLQKALWNVRALISEGAEHGFNPMVGDWAERLFASNGESSAALRKAEGAE